MTPERVGRYEIKAKLGQGGMASVYRAYDPRFKRDVAVKILPRQLMLDDPQFRARFEREAETIAKLEHPAIVPVYDYGEEDDQPYLVMRLMTGGSLDERIAQGAIPVSEAAKILDRIGSALDRAHDYGIIHRDLKPGNILFDQYGDAFLADFGIVKLTQSGDTLTVTGGIVGTPAYMSPEQIQGDKDKIDGRSDIYALGIIVFEMLTGQKPYEANTPAMMLVKQMTEPMPHVLDVKPDLPSGCEEVITRATSKEADQRYGRAGEMAETLNIALHTQSAPTVETPTPEPTIAAPVPVPEAEPTPDVAETETTPPPQSSRRKWVFAGLGIVLLLLIGFVLMAIFADNEQDTPTQVDESPPNLNLDLQATEAPGSLDSGQFELRHQLGRGTIETAELSPDGQMLAVGGSVGVWIYDAHSLEPLNLLQGHMDIVSDVAWSPDGGRVVSAGWDGTLRFWDVATGEQIGIIEGDDQFIAVAWTPDGRQIAATTWTSPIMIFDAETTRLTGELLGHEDSVTHLRFSPDGRWLASANGGENSTIRLWDAESGEEKMVISGHDGDIANLSWAPDSTRLASAGLDDNVVRVWDSDANIGEALYELAGHEYGAFDMAMSPDGTEIVTTGGDNTLLLWDTGNGRQIGHLLEVTDLVWRIIPLNDSNQYLLFQANGSILVANAANGNIEHEQHEHTAAMHQVVWSPDNHILATANSDGSIRLWEGANGAQIANWKAHEYGVTTLVWTPEGKRIISAGEDGAVRLWDVERQVVINAWQHPDGSVSSLALSPDGTTLAIADWAGVLRLVNTSLEEMTHEWQAHDDAITRVAWSPDGHHLATSGADRIVTIWKGGTDAEPLFFAKQPELVSDLAWSPDGTRLATTGHDFSVRVWDAASGEELWQKAHLELASSVAWSPDGTILASGGWDQTIRLWHAADGTALGELGGHVGPVITLDWAPEGNTLASGSGDGTSIIWGKSD